METTVAAVLNKSPITPLAACLMAPLALGNFASAAAAATTLGVTNCNDAGSGSLRDALANAHNGDSIDMAALACGKISIATGALQVPFDDLTLQGPGANALTISGGQSYGHSYSVLNHTGQGTLRVDALTVTDGLQQPYGPGCIVSSGTVYLNRSIVTKCHARGVVANGFSARDSTISNSLQGVVTTYGNVSIIGSTISGNGFSGTSIYCTGLELGTLKTSTNATVVISNSTISGNSAYESAACVVRLATRISNSTIAFNRAQSRTSGMEIFSPDVKIESSIFASNTVENSFNGSFDLAVVGQGAHISGHNNIIMTASASFVLPADTIMADPRLLPLADNGGPTRTHALGAASAAIDAGNNLAGLPTDQRGSGFPRSAGARTDIGAFESQAPAITSGAIGPGFTGSWFDPAQSGHGLMIEVLSDHRLLAMWFAFNPEGTQQTWFGGVGTYEGNTATITDVAQPTGGRWIPNFDPNSIVRNPWGTLTFTFADCDHGRVDFSSGLGYGNGSMNLLRLTQPAGLTCP